MSRFERLCRSFSESVENVFDPPQLKDRLREWQGKRRQKEAAADLDIPLPTYRKFLYGKRTPNKLALSELLRRMEK